MKQWIILIVCLLNFFRGCSQELNNRYVFPLDIHFRSYISTRDLIQVSESIDFLNKSFNDSGIQFRINTIDVIGLPYIQDLVYDRYKGYLDLSSKLDRANIAVWVTDNDMDQVCDVNEISVSCTNLGGFSLVANTATNNIVLSRIDLYESKIMSHEFGHFFGLYHTFETKFGRELADGSIIKKDNLTGIIDTIPYSPINCTKGGDLVCDTPPDPSVAFSSFASYEECELFYLDYKPMINNIMSYYNTCKDREPEFTRGQIARIKKVGLPLRKERAYFEYTKK